MRFDLAEWFVKHSEHLPRVFQSKETTLDHIKAWVAFSPGFNGDITQLDLPWEEQHTKEWFKALSIDDVTWEFYCAAKPDFELDNSQMRVIVERLGVVRASLGELIRGYEPPPSDGFDPVPPLKPIADRENVCGELLRLLDDDKTTVTSLVGLDGVGKTTLAAWLAAEARNRGYRVRWMDCSEKRDVTVRWLLATVSNEAPFKLRTALRTVDQPLTDRMDAALEFLNKQATLLVFNDYHAISRQEGIEQLITRSFRHGKNLRIVLTTSEHSISPNWPADAVLEITVGSLPLEAIPQLMCMTSLQVDLTPQQQEIVWKRTCGNARILVMSADLIRQYVWLGKLEDLPLKDDLFSTLFCTLSDEARDLAQSLSVIQAKLSVKLILGLYQGPQEKAVVLISELVDKCFLQELEQPGTFVMDNLAREYLYSRMGDKPKREAHRLAGIQFANMADEIQVEVERIEYLIEAIRHFELGGPRKELLKRGEAAYAALITCGDVDRAQWVAEKALVAARADQDSESEKACYWLIEVAERELYRGHYPKAEDHLNEAAACLPKPGKKMSAERIAHWQALETRICKLHGQRAYYVADYATASNYFEKGLAIAQKIDDQRATASFLVWIGRIKRQRKQYEQAEPQFLQARKIAEQLRDRGLAIDCTSHLGLIALGLGRYDEAREFFTSAYEIAEREGDPLAAEMSLSHMGRLELRLGNLAQAEETFRKCLKLAEEIRAFRGIRILLTELAETLIRLGKYGEAKVILADSEKRNQDSNDQIGIAWNLKHRGQIAKAAGEIDYGNSLMQQGIQKLVEIGNKEYIPEFEEARLAAADY